MDEYLNSSYETKLEKICSPAFDIGLSGFGTFVGFLAGSSIGAIIGATLPSITKCLIEYIDSEVLSRRLSQRELLRTGVCTTFALDSIQKNISDGKILRNDDFFDLKDNTRSNANEILEAVLLASQREYQELKICHLGKLFGNIIFESEISIEEANFYISSLIDMSYQQLCMLAFFYKREECERFEKYKLGENKLVYNHEFNRHYLDEYDLKIQTKILEFENMTEFRFLGQLGHFSLKSPYIKDLEITKYGKTFSRLADLSSIDDRFILDSIDFAYILEKN